MSLPPYQLSVDGFAPNHFRVRAFTGKEAISEAYSFDLVVTGEAGSDAVEHAALGQRAVLLFNVGEAPRAFYGIIASVRLDEVHQASQSIEYRLRFVPRLWLLKRKQRTRIFQKMRVPDIVTAVLLEAGISTRWQLTHAYPEREYTTQYEETDYRFIKRILAEAGIYFYFPGGPAVDAGALGAGAALGAASAVVGAVAGSAIGSLVGSAASMGEPLIPGDTVICADDAACYPPLRGDNAAALAASTAAAMAPAIGDALGAGSGIAGGVIGSVAAFTGRAIADEVEGSRDVPVLRFLRSDAGALQKHDRVTIFTLRNAVRSSAAAFRDYDPDRPMVRLESKAASTQPFPPSPLDAAAMAASAVGSAAAAAGGLIPGAAGALGAVSTASALVSEASSALSPSLLSEVYEHHSPFLFPKWAFASDEAPRILRQKRRRASIASGEGACSDLCAGHRFMLEEHPATQLDGTYVVVSVEHRGETRADRGNAFTAYWNAFECAPAEMAYVPPRPKRTSVQVSLTATVVGPPREEIYVDERGQIKVQFHWDREGTYDERSSCWIRTMQPWAGAAWGHQFIPRVGMEVVVVFEGGDPDKPMVIGSVYNGTHPSPFPLPADKTRSGLRTQTSPGGGGFNELSFEDAAGREQIYVHAQRNLDEKVGKNHTLLVGNDELVRILGNRMDTIEKNLESLVKGDQTSHVDGNRVDVVKGNSDERVSGTLATRVEGRERRSVTGNADLEYAADLTTRVLGSITTIVGKQEKKRSWATHAEGTAALSGLDRLELRSDKELVLSVGKSSIRITPDKIELSSAALTAKGGGAGLSASDDGLALSSKGDAQMVVGKKIVFKTDGASIGMEKEVKIDGAKILLNSPEQAKDPPPRDPEPPTKIELTDDDGKALPQQRFRIVLDDKSELTGMTDQDGKAELELKSGGKITFPDVTMPADQSGKGPILPYVVEQGDYLSKLAFAHGFDEDEVWNDPKNAELKGKRKSPNLLHPGDILQFPRPKREGLPLSKGTTNKYKAKVPKTGVHLVFKNEKGPIANEPYIVQGLGAPEEGTSDGDGGVTIKMPIHVREIHVTFPKQQVSYPVRVGDMDPVDEPMGARKRLEHMGYRAPSTDAASESEADEKDQEAIAAFQRDQGLEPTGTLDAETAAALVKAHGS